MNIKSIGLWVACLAIAFSFSSCDVLNQLIAAQGVQSGNASIIKGDNTLPGAQKGGFAGPNKPYKSVYKPNGVRYKDDVFQNVKKTHETYATGVKMFNGQQKNLIMDIYTPQGDNASNRPCVVFLFGGGWFMKTLDGMEQFGQSFAKKGYVGVSIDYRIGFQNGTGMGTCKNNYSGFNEAWYRAAQDAKAAIRYLKANADRLGIDKTKIVIGGHSAGAFTALNAVHLDDADVPQAIRSKEGGVNSIGGHQNENTTVAAEYILAGGAINTLDYIDKKVPTFILMGTCDKLLVNGSGRVYKCNTNPMVHTGQALNDKLKRNGACVQFAVSCGGDHSFGKLPSETMTRYVCDFVYSSLKGNCNTIKVGVQAPSKSCTAVDNSVCG